MTPDEPVPQLDYLSTSRRPPWPQLPAAVRAAVADAAGGEVASVAAPVTSGFSGGFAAVVRLTDGRDVFARAGSSANPHLLEAYAREAVVLAGLPAGVPAPRLVGAVRLDADGTDWQVLVTHLVRGEIPQPWTAHALAAAHEACVRVAETLTPPPPDLTLGTLGASAGARSSTSSPRSPRARRRCRPALPCGYPAGCPSWRHWSAEPPGRSRAAPACTTTCAPTTSSSTPTGQRSSTGTG